MIDIKLLREKPEVIKEALKKRGVEVDVDYLKELDQRIRGLKKEIDDLRRRRNEISKRVKDVPKKIEEAKKIKEELKKKEEEIIGLQKEFDSSFLLIPNIPLKDTPVGKDENDNVIIEKWGEPKEFNFQIKDHLEIGELWDLIDVKRAAKISGSRFGILKNEAVLLEFALIKFTYDFLTKKYNFIPVIPPILIRPEVMRGMGYIDIEQDLEERYFLEKDNLFLIGTAEQAVGPMHQNETFEEKELPKRYLAFSTCLREEAGSYGKDTRGIFRVHQFDKIEMFSFTRPEDSQKELQFLLGVEKDLMKQLRIPFRVVKLCTGDLSRPSAQSFDIETWIPSQEKYRETHSCSNCTDFQARRLNIRFKREKSNQIEFIHTLNGTAFAIGRIIIAILENYQQKDGRILVPKVLRKYTGFRKIPR